MPIFLNSEEENIQQAGFSYHLANGQNDIGIATANMAEKINKGVPQAGGSVTVELTCKGREALIDFHSRYQNKMLNSFGCPEVLEPAL